MKPLKQIASLSAIAALTFSASSFAADAPTDDKIIDKTLACTTEEQAMKQPNANTYTVVNWIGCLIEAPGEYVMTADMLPKKTPAAPAQKPADPKVG